MIKIPECYQYWILWQIGHDLKKAYVASWLNNELGEKASDILGPSISFDDLQGSALLEAIETKQTTSANCTEQNLAIENIETLGNTFVLCVPIVDNDVVTQVIGFYDTRKECA